MSRMGLDKKSMSMNVKTSLIGQEHPTQKPRPSSSKPVQQKNDTLKQDLDVSNISRRPPSPGNPPRPGSAQPKKQRMRSSSPAVQTQPGGGVVKATTLGGQQMKAKSSSYRSANLNTSLNSKTINNQKVSGLVGAGHLSNKLVPQLYMRGYSPSKPQWKF